MKGTILEGAYVMINSIAENVVEYDKTVNYLASEEAGGREYSFDPKGSTKEVWADGKVVFARNNNSGYDGTVTLIDIIDQIRKDWYGYVEGENGAMAEIADGKDMPKFAWIQRVATSDGQEILEVYPYAYISQRANIKGKTEDNGDFDYEFVEHHLSIRPRPGDGIVMWTMPAPKEKLTKMPEFTAKASSLSARSYVETTATVAGGAKNADK